MIDQLICSVPIHKATTGLPLAYPKVPEMCPSFARHKLMLFLAPQIPVIYIRRVKLCVGKPVEDLSRDNRLGERYQLWLRQLRDILRHE